MIGSIPYHLKDGKECYAWENVVANGTGSLVFTDNVTADGSIRMNSDVCGDIQYFLLRKKNAKYCKTRKICCTVQTSMITKNIM